MRTLRLIMITLAAFGAAIAYAFTNHEINIQHGTEHHPPSIHSHDSHAVPSNHSLLEPGTKNDSGSSHATRPDHHVANTSSTEHRCQHNYGYDPVCASLTVLSVLETHHEDVKPSNGSTTQQPHDRIAYSDMYAHVNRHLDQYAVRPQTFGTSQEWTGDWELRWMDFVRKHEVVRIYHVTNKHDPELRFTAMWDAQHGRWSAWELAE